MPGAFLCRTALPEDRAFLLDLWGRVFGDGPTYATHCLDAFAGTGNVLVAQHGAAPAAMLLAVPCHMDDAPGVYLYALATEPCRRGAGVMSALMAHSEALAKGRGAAFAVLIPATAALYPYYQKRGYEKRLYLRHVRLPLGDHYTSEGMPRVALGQGLANAPVYTNPKQDAPEYREESPTGARLAQLRGQWLHGPAVRFDAARAGLVARDVAETGAVLAVSENAYAVALPGKGALLAAELAGRNDEAALFLLHALAVARGLRQARVTLPLSSRLLAGRGMVRPAALLKPLSAAFCFDTQSYLRFAMDEPFVFGLPRA